MSPLTPVDVTGTYALVSINGQLLPAPYGQGSAALYDTLTLAPDSTVTDRFGAGALGSRVVTYRTTFTGRWTLDASGGRVLLTEVDQAGTTTTTSSWTVVNRGARLTVYAGPVNPSNPGGGYGCSIVFPSPTRNTGRLSRVAHPRECRFNGVTPRVTDRTTTRTGRGADRNRGAEPEQAIASARRRGRPCDVR